MVYNVLYDNLIVIFFARFFSKMSNERIAIRNENVATREIIYKISTFGRTIKNTRVSPKTIRRGMKYSYL